MSVFGVDFDRKEKAEGQRGASDLLCHFCSYTFHHLVIVFLLHFSDCVFTSASQYKYKEEEACLARALFCSFAFHQLQLFSRNRLATWIFPLNIFIGNLNIPRSSTCKWQSLLQSFRHCKWYSEYKLNLILFVKWSFCKSSIQARIWQIAKSWYHIIISDNILN